MCAWVGRIWTRNSGQTSMSLPVCSKRGCVSCPNHWWRALFSTKQTQTPTLIFIFVDVSFDLFVEYTDLVDNYRTPKVILSELMAVLAKLPPVQQRVLHYLMDHLKRFAAKLKKKKKEKRKKNCFCGPKSNASSTTESLITQVKTRCFRAI